MWFTRPGDDTDHRSRTLLDSAPVPIVELDRSGVVLVCNRSAAALVGWPAQDLIGRPLADSILVRRPDVPTLLRRLHDHGDEPAVVQLRCRHRQGRLIEVELRATPTREPDGTVRGAILVLCDVTAQRRRERRLHYQVEHDALTHLPNRESLLAQLVDALAAGRTSGEHTALMVINLTHFREVNDTLGYACADQVLALIGPRLLADAVRDGDLVARLAGDKFAVLAHHLSGAAAAAELAERVLDALHRPFHVDGAGVGGASIEGASVDLSASIGVAIAPQHGDTAPDLVRNADSAMRAAQRNAGGIVLFRPESRVPERGQFGLVGPLRRALERHELVVYYQPKVDVRTEQLQGAEALVRWEHPTRGLVGPGEFIPAAEANGLIIALTDYVLDSVLAQIRTWSDTGSPVPVSVNLSARSLDDLTLPKRIRARLARHRLAPRMLALEITETAVMRDPDIALIVLDELSSAGIELSIDDFGTGYSSMSYLQRLPVTELKIDRSFVADLARSPASEVLVRSTIDIGHGLNLRVVAEGVEDAPTLTRLRELGCDCVQGFHVAHPMPTHEFEAWTAVRRHRPPAPREIAPSTASTVPAHWHARVPQFRQPGH